VFDVLLSGGTLIDGTGAPLHSADVGVVGERVVAVGDLRRRDARQAIDAAGHFVAPGFIDIHAHSELTLLVDPRATSKVRQGITTEVSGQCGMSAAPLAGQARGELGVWATRFGLAPPDWRSLADYLEVIERRGVALNFGTFVGHDNLRYAVIGSADRPPAPAELDGMTRILSQALEEGGLGLSSGLFYAPGSYAHVAELTVLGQAVAAHGGLYATHVRNEGPGLVAALDEAIAVGRASGAPVEISHLKLASRAQWGQAEHVLAHLDRHRAEGVEVSWDQYPYTAAATTLDAAVPPRFHVGGTAALLARLQDPQARAEIAGAIATGAEDGWENMAQNSGWANIVLSFHPTRPELVGRAIAEIATSRGTDPLEAALDLILETQSQAEIVDYCMDERDVETILRHPCTVVATDAEAQAADGPLAKGTPHPRGYGAFPRVLARYVRERGVLTWEEAIRKMTGLPAERLDLRDRGIVRAGAFADLVVLDPGAVCDTATFAEPCHYPEGIRHVLVNGRFVVRDSVQTEERPGHVLRSQK
jgi:N-acyl-D-amino-acid deacylase